MIQNKKLFKILGVPLLGTVTLFSLIVGSSEPARARYCDVFGLGICTPGEPSGSDPQQQNPRPRPSTILEYCNNSSSKLYVARAYFSGNQGWRSSGWTNVNPKTCQTVNIGNYNGDVFIYAENGNGGVYSGSGAYFCIDGRNAFDFAKADQRNCSGGTLKKVGMNKWTVRPGKNTNNFN